MQEQQFFWSERARYEFAALFEDRDYSDRFRSAVAEALTRGWSGNRDKPFWALATLVAALAEAGDAAGGAGQEASLDLVWADPDALYQRLLQLSAEDRAELACRVFTESGNLVIEARDGSWRVSRMRVAILRKLAEFFLACDEFAFAPDVMKIFADLEQAGLRDAEALKDATRALSRLAYKYRTDNFRDGHASSGFSILKSYLARRESFTIDDATVFDFWVWPDNTKYKTYDAVFHAFADLYDALKDVRAINSIATADQLDNPALAGELSVPFVEPELAGSGAEEAGASLLSLVAYGGDEDDDGPDAPDGLQPLKETSLRLYKKAELGFLGQIADAGEFGRTCTLACLRLIAFHPVQSAISNSLRTGRSKLPLERRVACEEAMPYPQISTDLDTLGEKTRSWLKVALSTHDETPAADEPSEQARHEGVVFLKATRSKSFAIGQDALREELQMLEAALIAAEKTLSAFQRNVRGRFGNAGGETLDALFREDVERFAEVFRSRYLETTHAEGPAPHKNDEAEK